MEMDIKQIFPIEKSIIFNLLLYNYISIYLTSIDSYSFEQESQDYLLEVVPDAVVEEKQRGKTVYQVNIYI